MVDRLSEAEMRRVQKHIERTLKKRKLQQKRVELKKYTKEEFLALIDESIEQGKRGEVYTWEEIRRMTREKYGF